MSEHPEHPSVLHPVRLRIKRHRGGMGPVGKANDWLATHLAAVFGVCWTVWAFFIWPLIALHLGSKVQTQTSYYAQSWIQLFALPLMVYVGNKLQRSSDAQSEVMHQALTHIATVADLCADLLDLETSGGLAVVRAETLEAKAAAETASEAMKMLTSVLGAKTHKGKGAGV